MKNSTKKGFTIIELMIAMIFLSTLLIVIAILVLNIITIFQKGLSIKSINSASRALIDDFNRSVSGSLNVQIAQDTNENGYIDAAESGAGYHQYFFQDTTNSIVIPANQVETARSGEWPIRGAFCTGGVTYIWNTGYVLNEDYAPSASSKKPYKHVMVDGGIEFRVADSWDDEGIFQLIKIQDPTRQMCSERAKYDKDDTDRPIKITFAGGNIEILEMLESSKPSDEDIGRPTTVDEYGLAIYDFRIFPAVRNDATKHIFYSGTFILGTLRGGVDIMANGDFCQDNANSLASDFAYCSINKFNFSMRATGETKKGDL